MTEQATATADRQGPPPFFSLKNLWYWTRLIAVVLFIKGCVVDQYRIPSRSMEPTLHAGGYFDGDRILVNKWIMGPRIPFTTIRLWQWYEPKRWDMVVFHTIEDKSREKVLVKRIVGLPGERIKIHHGGIIVNGEKIEKPESMPETNWYFSPDDLRKFADPNQRAMFEELLRMDPIKYAVSDEDEYAVIPEGHYLMLGDNSMESHDGRMYGWVPANHIFGRVFAIWFPFDRMRDFTGFSQTWWGPFAIYVPIITLLLWIVWDVMGDLRKLVRRGVGKPPADKGDNSG